MPRLPVTLLAIGVVAGCGGSSVPEGTPIAVRFEVVEHAGPFGAPTIAQPLTVHETDQAWARVRPLLPVRLPEPVDQGDDCVSGLMVSVMLVTKERYAGEVNYGPCRWPEEIEPVRLLMQTLLTRRLARERRCDCP